MKVEPEPFGRVCDNSLNPVSLTKSSPINPVLGNRSEKVNPNRASLSKFGRMAKLSHTTRLRVGLASVRGPETWYAVGVARSRFLKLKRPKTVCRSVKLWSTRASNWFEISEDDML